MRRPLRLAAAAGQHSDWPPTCQNPNLSPLFVVQIGWLGMVVIIFDAGFSWSRFPNVSIGTTEKIYPQIIDSGSNKAALCVLILSVYTQCPFPPTDFWTLQCTVAI